ncbi:DUF2834 domain-containing protein [Prochlorococcus marinus]|uniref:DUF2834 domain-containing protein n=1 Tax=Prochlorococcus marinus TaxID=1219 RepID=UPI0022B3A938|nr:DUF2834 domain-containing protein [Prochlorococcus marinus]
MIKQIKWLKWVYLLLSILGAVLPTLANIEFVKSYGPGFDIQLFVELANNNPASQSLSRDLFIGSTAVFIWILSESKRLEMKNLWIVILTTFTIAFAFAAPFFLYLRELRIEEMNRNQIILKG